ncbi:hypothetical protein BDB00DRAFT_867460 [Zychaea mexicana]|uniref:uncharacterized protein n=1 Tax=Zychaea mexicana TaxID=64656 RepID=UPI0022FED034|nr:uncharacterized protein BDB00DRAFT_867460 [Zychaea mexicana]KAI9498297.1 hypothetical protein BDB00DRAFT_867460 [Zychaea mexicana]
MPNNSTEGQQISDALNQLSSAQKVILDLLQKQHQDRSSNVSEVYNLIDPKNSMEQRVQDGIYSTIVDSCIESVERLSARVDQNKPYASTWGSCQKYEILLAEQAIVRSTSIHFDRCEANRTASFIMNSIWNSKGGSRKRIAQMQDNSQIHV